MQKGKVVQFLKGRTSHRFPKIVTLALASSVLVTMVTIDASASTQAKAGTANTNLSSLAAAGESNSGAPAIELRHRLSAAGTNTTASQVGTTTSSTPSDTVTATTLSGTTTTTAPVHSTTAAGVQLMTTTPVQPTTTKATSPTLGGLIAAGPSRNECITADLGAGNYGLQYLQAAITKFNNATGTSVSCITSFINGAQTWAQWDNPWITQSQYGYSSWVAEAPQSRQLVIGVDLIPSNLANISNPLGWEQSCAAGNFNSYATQLGTNLVAAGLQNSVLRLGEEMNGPWENDFIGNTVQEQNLWASCFANEVTALRQATGEHFLIDWNPNACSENIPYVNFYPGNAYVDILGLDLYDQSCVTPATPVAWTQLANETAGLTVFQTFAAAHGKAMSLPEWGLVSNSGGDDPGYINGIGSVVNSGNFAFESYFDAGNGGVPQLGPNTPLSAAAFAKQFG